jgi:hypothetical protein
MEPYARGLVLLVIAAVFGIAVLVLPDGLPAGLAGIGLIGFALAGIGNVIATARH